MQTFEKVCEIISCHLVLPEGFEFSEGTTWTDLEADSLDLVEIIMSVEDEFSIEVPDEDISAMQSMGDLVAYIDGKI